MLLDPSHPERGRFPFIASGTVARRWRLQGRELKFYFELLEEERAENHGVLAEAAHD